jgi:hypothetical protein
MFPKLTTWSRVFEKLVVIQLVKFCNFYGTQSAQSRNFLTCRMQTFIYMLQEPITRSSPDQMDPVQILTLHSIKIHFDNVSSYMPVSPK